MIRWWDSYITAIARLSATLGHRGNANNVYGVWTYSLSCCLSLIMEPTDALGAHCGQASLYVYILWRLMEIEALYCDGRRREQKVKSSDAFLFVFHIFFMFNNGPSVKRLTMSVKCRDRLYQHWLMTLKPRSHRTRGAKTQRNTTQGAPRSFAFAGKHECMLHTYTYAWKSPAIVACIIRL